MNSRLIRRPEAEVLIGLSRSTIYQMMAEAKFPRPIKIGKRAVAWRLEEIESWINAKST